MSESVDLKIVAERCVYRGEKYWKIKDFSCYGYEDLPFKYFETLPACARDKDTFVMVYSNEECLEFKVGDLIPEKSFTRLIRTLRFTGHKLHLLADEIKQLRKDWRGEETFDISAESYVPKPRQTKKAKKNKTQATTEEQKV